MLVDYSYYIEDFGGEKISSESDFKRIRNLAETHLCNFTFDRIKNDVENEHLIKSCICEMCDTIYDMTLKDGGKVKKSENTENVIVADYAKVDVNDILKSTLPYTMVMALGILVYTATFLF